MQVGRFKMRPKEVAVVGGAALAADTLVGQFWPEYSGVLTGLFNLLF